MRDRELKIYIHQELMSEYNDTMIVIKKALYKADNTFYFNQIDELQNKVFEILRKESKEMRHYKGQGI
jgi:hypothetical protein